MATWLTPLVGGSDRQGSDGCRLERRPNAALGMRADSRHRHESDSTYPIALACGKVLTFDGRLDNRLELIVALDEELNQVAGKASAPAIDGTTRDTPDHSIALAAWLRWKDAAVEHLIGDFAFALYDEASESVSLVRDFAGTRPLYFVREMRGVLWASDLAGLTKLTNLSSEVSDEYIASYLILDEDVGRTPYRNIRCVPPGSLVRAGHDGERIRRYWTITSTREIHYKCDADYEEHLFHLLRESIRVRLRSTGPAVCELSGGVDSSSIVCIADRLHSEGLVGDYVRTASYIWDGSPGSDERKYVHEVEKMRKIQGLHVFDDEILSWTREVSHTVVPNPMHCLPGTNRADAEYLK